MKAKKILITGAGSGLGKGTALQLAKNGHNVIACVELLPQVTQLREEAKKNNISLTVEQVNIKDPQFPYEQYDPKEMIDKMVEVAESDEGLYRNICPKEFIDVVKKTEADNWTKKQNAPLH